MTVRQLTPAHLIHAYSRGVFPMAHDDGYLYWHDPDPRAILPLDKFHCPRSLKRTVRKGRFEVRINDDFERVIHACAAPAEGRESTWINERIVALYTALHWLGHAHSVEAWYEGELAGGLYGVTIGGFFAGESMFSLRRDASKVALVHLVERLRSRGYTLLDVQYATEHLRRFGVIEISRQAYRRRLAGALALSATFA